jgi:hypothetical protein
VLTEEFIQQIINVQIAACFTTTVLDVLNIDGFIERHVLGPCTAESQAELNQSYSGKKWSLAEKYTGIAKILFISLFYALLTPLSLLIATVAIALVFLVDRYQLLRRWKPMAMLDANIASRFGLCVIVFFNIFCRCARLYFCFTCWCIFLNRASFLLFPDCANKRFSGWLPTCT